MKSNIGIFPVPALPGAKYPKILSGGPNNDYVIFKNTKYPEQAMELVKFLVSTKVQEMALDQGFGQLPDNAAYVAGPSLKTVDPVLAETYQYIRVQHYQLAEAFDNIMPGSIDSYWYQTNSGVFGGSLSPSVCGQEPRTTRAELPGHFEQLTIVPRQATFASWMPEARSADRVCLPL